MNYLISLRWVYYYLTSHSVRGNYRVVNFTCVKYQSVSLYFHFLPSLLSRPLVLLIIPPSPLPAALSLFFSLQFPSLRRYRCSNLQSSSLRPVLTVYDKDIFSSTHKILVLKEHVDKMLVFYI